jgi:predicted transcriptional regulator
MKYYSLLATSLEELVDEVVASLNYDAVTIIKWFIVFVVFFMGLHLLKLLLYFVIDMVHGIYEILMFVVHKLEDRIAERKLERDLDYVIENERWNYRKWRSDQQAGVGLMSGLKEEP